jgi:hypothetical protein
LDLKGGIMLNFNSIKTIVSDCICKTTAFLGQKITEDTLNLLANEYTDKIIEEIKIKKIKREEDRQTEKQEEER